MSGWCCGNTSVSNRRVSELESSFLKKEIWSVFVSKHGAHVTTIGLVCWHACWNCTFACWSLLAASRGVTFGMFASWGVTFGMFASWGVISYVWGVTFGMFASWGVTFGMFASWGVTFGMFASWGVTFGMFAS